MSKVSGKKRRKKDPKGKGLIAAVVLILCIVLAYNSREMNIRLEEYKENEARLQEQIDEQKEIRQGLDEKSEYVNSDEYYKELAREKLGLANDGDIIFKKQNN